MESNREEAEKCIDIAAQAFKEYKTQRAKNFLKKAERLYPTQKAKDLLEKVSEFEKDQHVRRILGCKSHHDVLEVPKDATDKDILAAFKKLALLVHPDKNRAHRANEAFVKVKEAKKALTNPIVVLDEGTDHQTCENNNTFEYEFNGSDDEVDEELYSQADRSSSEKRKWWENKTGYYILVFLPVILLLLTSAVCLGLKSVLVSPSIYSLSPDINHVVRRRTMAAKIPYYVTRDFSQKLQHYYGGSLGKLERDVKNEHMKKLTRECKREKKEKSLVLKAAELSFNKNTKQQLYARAQSMGTPSCVELELLTSTLNHSNSYFWHLFSIFAKFLYS